MTTTSRRSDVGILGAGIMGCCLALELAQRGRRVDLIDRAPTPMTGASLHNEGKLHLGFVYANDPLKATHGLMVRGSLSFARIIKKLTGRSATDLAPSHPFHYFVPLDSQLDISRIHDHFREVELAILDVSRSTGDLYLDLKTDRYCERNSAHEHGRLFSVDSTIGSFRTWERSVSPAAVAGILVQAVSNHPNINFIGDREILSAGRLVSGDVEIESSRAGRSSSARYACVANCLWDDRLRVDRTAGIPDDGPWLLRYKATVTVTVTTPAPRFIPSATGILGPYGDVVNHDDGSYYISWYPLCRVAQTIDGNGRALHDMVHTGIASRLIRRALSERPSLRKMVSSFAHQEFVKENLSTMAAFIPSMEHLLREARHHKIGGGVIVARGATDIDDPRSYLHQRSAVGPVAHGSYLSIDTGKYCLAPLFALEAANLIMDVLR